jgi:hypothetical protein
VRRPATTQSEPAEFLEAVVDESPERKLLEILGDPDEGLEIKEALRERLLVQKQAVSRGQRGQSLGDVVREIGLD